MDKKYLENQASILINHYNFKRFEDVVQRGKVLIKKFPNQLIFYNATALSLAALGKNQEALSFLKTALNLSPRDINVLNNLGLVNSNLNKNKEARDYLEKALTIKNDFMDALLNLGNLDLKEGKINEAKNNLYMALKQSKTASSDVTINMAIGNLNQQLGEFDKAKENYKIVNKIDPLNTFVDKSISDMHKYLDQNDPHILSMKEKINKISDNESLKSLYFALGKAFEDIKDFKESFKYLRLGNNIADKLIRYDIEDDKNLFLEIKRIFKNYDKNKEIKSKQKIIFIIGMPRSGTTLVEQILSSHKEVYGAGELNYLSEAVENLSKNKLDDENILWQNFQKIENLNYEKLKQAQLEYLEKLKLHNFNEKFITDKAPLNFRWIGFIRYIFPESKIIHCNRDGMDICYSNFKNSFSAGSLGFCYNLKKLGNYYNIYKDLMAFWDKDFNDQIYEISYENLVKNKESEIKDLLKFCGLEWDERCLNPHENTKVVATASIAQVRTPVYNTSINKWKNVEDELKELKEIIQ